MPVEGEEPQMRVGWRVVAVAAVACALAAVAVIGGFSGTDGLVALGLAGLGLLVVALQLDARRRASVAQRRAARTAERHQARLVEHLEAVGSDVAALRATVADPSDVRDGTIVAHLGTTITTGFARSGARVERALHYQTGTLLTEAQALQQLLARYNPPLPLPDVAGWALSPSAILRLVSHVEQHRPDFVVECGSGTSTLWLAHALESVGHGRLVALEHDERFVARTQAVLEAHGLAGRAQVRHAPLVPRETPHGELAWYDVDASTLDGIGLLVVDGPPAVTGPQARYPALPALRARLQAGATVVVDDVQRKDEAEAVAAWLAEDPTLQEQWQPGRDVKVLRVVG